MTFETPEMAEMRALAGTVSLSLIVPMVLRLEREARLLRDRLLQPTSQSAFNAYCTGAPG